MFNEKNGSSELSIVRIGARQSDLSKIQSYEVGKSLARAYPNLKVDYYFKTASGDLDQLTSLAAFGGKGVFTQDLTSLLISSEVDMVVHSFKDLPTEPNPKTDIAGTLNREDMRDLLLIRKDLISPGCKIKNFTVLSSSPRRSRNIGIFLPKALPFDTGKISFEDVRGNVPTRLKKLLSGKANALVVAKAAIERFLKCEDKEFKDSKEIVELALKNCYSIVLPLSENPCAPAQGALAIEIRKSDSATRKLIEPITSYTDFESVLEEREVLSSYGGGCHQKIGVASLKKTYGRILFVQGETPDGKDLRRSTLKRINGEIPKASKDAIWPPTKEEGRSIFNREDISTNKPTGDTPLWISRDTALPNGWEPSWDTPIWCAGIETWKKLCERGVLVNGSSESLGETEDPKFNIISGRDLKWTKLSHTLGEKSEWGEFLPTYKLTPSGDLPNLSGKTHFFWMSGSQFLYLLEKFPEIIKGFHASGPGNTASTVARSIGDTSRQFVYLSYEDWRQEVLR